MAAHVSPFRLVAVIATVVLTCASTAPTTSAQYRRTYPVPVAAPYYNAYPGGFMSGRADVIDAKTDAVLKSNTYFNDYDARKVNRAENRIKLQEMKNYEKSITPTREDRRREEQETVLRRSLNNPPASEIYSGYSLNSLLTFMMDAQMHGATGPEIRLDREVLKHINVTTPATQGNMGILKDSGKLDWPVALEGVKEPLNTLVPKAVAAVESGKPDKQLISQIERELVNLDKAFDKIGSSPDILFSDFADASKFIKNLKSGVRELKQPTAVNYYNGTYALDAHDVTELVAHMSRNGLQFAAATPGDETYYVSFYRPFSAYATALQDKASFNTKLSPGTKPTPPPPPPPDSALPRSTHDLTSMTPEEQAPMHALLALAMTTFAAEPAAQPAGGLAVRNERFTYGPQGAVRKDLKFLPGDIICMSCELDNLVSDKDGHAEYSITLEVLDSKGDLFFRRGPRQAKSLIHLGGDSLPVQGQAQIGLDTKPGDYTLKIKITDMISKSSKELTNKITVLPPGFGIVQVGINVDPEGHAFVPPHGVVGQSFYFNFGAVGYGRDASKKLNLHAEMMIVDDAGKSTIPQPLAGQVNSEIPEDVKVVPMQFGVVLSRAGSFTAKIKVTDKTSGKSSEISIPFKVVELK